MQSSARTKLLAALQTTLFVILLLAIVAMLAWLSEHYKLRWDWTAASRNTLTEPSRALLPRLEGAVNITAYVREEPVIRQSILQLLERYQRYKADITLKFVNPDLVPDEVRARNISNDGEMVVAFQGREALAKTATEEALTGALEKLARPDTRWVAYLSGHGERDLLGDASYDLGKLGAQLQRQGFKLHALNLADTGEVPAEASLLVVTSGREPLPRAQVDALLRYLDAGGSLLWLAEPGPSMGMAPVAEALGIVFEPGVLVDPTTRVLGIARPDFLPVSAYPSHPVTRNIKAMTVYPRAAGISWSQPPGWQTRGILSTSLRAWSETGDLSGELHFDDASDVSGPLDLAVAMQRTIADSDEPREQRVIVVGDGDFLSNAYVGNGANLDLALNMFNWLAEDEVLVDIPARTAPDLAFELTRSAELLIRLGVVLALPALLLGAGFFIWQRRRRL